MNRVSENFLDPDVAYLLGMIVARGQLVDTTQERLIKIQFPAKNLNAVGISRSYNQEKHIEQSLYRIKERLDSLVEARTEVNNIGGDIHLIFRFHSRNMSWRNLEYILHPNCHYHDFEVPISILDAHTDSKKEFVRGIADCAGFIRHSNNYMGGKRRVYLEINNRNWRLPTQLCRLLQQDLGVPVHMIQWGHPNTRQPYKTNSGTAWAKEHQIKIFAENFVKIGFYVSYKQEILEEFAEADRSLSGSLRVCHWNLKARRIREKPVHPDESHQLLPDIIAGQHFDSYRSLCRALGCCQFLEKHQEELHFDESEEE